MPLPDTIPLKVDIKHKHVAPFKSFSEMAGEWLIMIKVDAGWFT